VAVRFGCTFWLDRDPRELADLARVAEDAGFQDVWFPDHYFIREVYTALALAAAATRRVHLGTAVTSPFLRHPVLLASAVATLDEISEGRAIFGVGVGGHEFERHLGMTLDKPVGACREAVDLVRRLLAGETVTARGRHFTVEGARLTFTPSRRIPVYLAARGPQMLRLAGEVADGIITHGIHTDYLAFAKAQAEAGAAGAGRPAGSVHLGLMTDILVTDDLVAARGRLRPRCIFMAGGAYALELVARYGLTTEDVGPVRSAVHAGDMAAAAGAVNDRVVHAFCIAGAAEACREAVRAAARAGVTHVLVSLGTDKTAADQRRTLETLGREIVQPLAGL
jgi:5,10-methylenetetrahydromethanopterin reductase